MTAKASCALPVYSVRLVRERSIRYAAPPADKPRDAARVLHAAIGTCDREVLAALFLDVTLKPVGFHRVAIGTVSGVATTPREIFKAALLVNAASVLLGHNHPSGAMEPSDEDVAFTETIFRAARLLGIPLVDHVIVGPEPGVYYSFREAGMLPP